MALTGLLVVVASIGLQRPSSETLSWWKLQPNTIVSDTLLAAAGDEARAAPQTWFHLGNDGERAAGAFLPRNWTLACPQFHQYPWHPDALLGPPRRCVEEQRPKFIGVTDRFYMSDRRTRFHARDPKWAQPWLDFNAWGLTYLGQNCTLWAEAPSVRVFLCRTAAKS